MQLNKVILRNKDITAYLMRVIIIKKKNCGQWTEYSAVNNKLPGNMISLFYLVAILSQEI